MNKNTLKFYAFPNENGIVNLLESRQFGFAKLKLMLPFLVLFNPKHEENYFSFLTYDFKKF